MSKSMRTWTYNDVVGTLEESLIADNEAPAPSEESLSPDQIIVEVVTAALNPVDYKLPEAGWMGKVMIGRPATPGIDYCGRVTAKHPSNHAVEIGQLVFGGLPKGGQFGTTGQFTLTSILNCSSLPEGVDPNDAAAVGTAATTAYQSLVPHVKKGWNVFINGGSGGVGTWALQIAKVRGAIVTTSCSAANAELCRRLGADEVINYREVNLIDALKAKGQVFDAVIDNVGNEAIYANSGSYLKPGGWFVQVGTGPLSGRSIFTTLARHMWPTFLNSGRRRYYFVQQNNAADFFKELGTWMAEGKMRPVIDEVFEWKDVPAALSKVRNGRSQGKVLVRVAAQ